MLGVSADATLEEIRVAYRSRVKDVHPDARPDDPEASLRFRELRAAYEALSAAPARAQRPPSTTARASPTAPRGESGSFAKLFEEKRASARFGRSPQGQKGDQGEMRVPFSASILGGDHRLIVQFRHDPTPRPLLISLPAGLWSEDRLRVEGKIVRVLVEPHPQLLRVGSDVELDLPLSVAEACLGVELQVPTVGGMRPLIVPPGVQAGQALLLPGLGVPPEGAQRCVVSLRLPDVTRPELEQCIQRLAELEGPPPRGWEG